MSSWINDVEIKSARGIRPDGTKRDGKTMEVVAKIKIEQFDSISEAISKLSEPVALGLINTQYATNMKNQARAEATGEPKEEDLKMEVLMSLAQDPEGYKALQAVSSDPIRMRAFLAEKIRELKIAKGIPVAGQPAEETAAA